MSGGMYFYVFFVSMASRGSRHKDVGNVDTTLVKTCSPQGVILWGPPGTGKTLLAKAVANETAATFLRVVGSELIQKYLGDGPKLVREMFRIASEQAPSIIFIDEIDAVATKR